ncbi:MAG TPA: PEP-CTERM sorting domain-containing protein, partial [Chthoniobacterales bacterium]
NGFSSAISITSRTYFQFSDGTQNIYPKLFTDTAGAQAGYLSDKQGTFSGDLGASANTPAEDFTGTKLLASYTFSLTNAAPGTYVLLTTTLSPKGSGISNDSFAYFNAPAASYTFTVVPEPSTWSLVGVGALGAVGFGILRRRQRA